MSIYDFFESFIETVFSEVLVDLSILTSFSSSISLLGMGLCKGGLIFYGL